MKVQIEFMITLVLFLFFLMTSQPELIVTQALGSDPTMYSISGQAVRDIGINSSDLNRSALKTGNTTNSTGLMTDAAAAAKCVKYDGTKSAITVSCNVSLVDMAATIATDNVIRKDLEEGGWFLNSSIIILKGATLTMNSHDGVKWLKINSEGKPEIKSTDSDLTDDKIGSLSADNLEQNKKSNSVPHMIQVYGSLNLNGTKITSWDPVTKHPTGQNMNGHIPRPYIAVEEKADPSHITNSEIAYMGYNSSTKHGLNFHGGEHSILAGNKIHDLWFGLYVEKVGYMRVENNSIYNNIIYGLDPHTGTHHLIVKNNNIWNSTTGLICSIDCDSLVFENNQIHDNKKVGLMFSKNTSNSVARNNNISDSYTAISVSESNNNQVYGNTVSDNRFGIQIKSGSSNNTIGNNTIINSVDCGIAASAEVKYNNVINNRIFNTDKAGICLTKAANDNRFYSNMIDSANRFGISVRGKDVTGNIFESNIIRLVNEGIVVNNNTNTSFVNNVLNDIISNEYTVSANSTLNIEKSPSSNYRIKSAGTIDNTVKIVNSGKLEVFASAKEVGTEGEMGSRSIHDSDISPFIERILPATIIEIN
jgi:mannuronan 5-epimerase